MAFKPMNPRTAVQIREVETRGARAAWLLACDIASDAFGADVRVVLKTRGTVGRGGDEKTSTARKVACYLAQVVLNLPTARLAEASGMDRSSIYHNSSWVEDRKDEPSFERQVEALETALLAMAATAVLGHLQAIGFEVAGATGAAA
jgi:hypothetical protein